MVGVQHWLLHMVVIIDFLHLINHCDPSQGDDDSVTSLHVASYKGHINIVHTVYI